MKDGDLIGICILFMCFSLALATVVYLLKPSGTPVGLQAAVASIFTGTATATATATTSAPDTATVTTSAPDATTAPYVTQPPLTRYANFDLLGDDVSSSAVDASQCAVLCSGSQSCQFFVTDSAGKQCWLKKNPTSFSQNGDRVAYAPAGFTPPSTQFAPLMNFDHGGDDMPNQPLKKNQADCNQACVDTAGCQYYVVDSAGNNCYLKQDSAMKTFQRRSGLTTWVPPSASLPWSSRPAYDNTGTDVQYLETDPTTCGWKCGANAQCQFYVTDTAGTKCWLKATQGDDVPNADRATWAAPGQVFQPKLYVYTDSNFKGQSQWFYPGRYGWLPVWKFPNDAMSSLKVPPGFKVTLWDSKDFGGKSLVLGPGEYADLKVQKFNDIASALEFYAA